jgi:hypothetical protein
MKMVLGYTLPDVSIGAALGVTTQAAPDLTVP